MRGVRPHPPLVCTNFWESQHFCRLRKRCGMIRPWQALCTGRVEKRFRGFQLEEARLPRERRAIECPLTRTPARRTAGLGSLFCQWDNDVPMRQFSWTKLSRKWRLPLLPPSCNEAIGLRFWSQTLLRPSQCVSMPGKNAVQNSAWKTAKKVSVNAAKHGKVSLPSLTDEEF